MDSISNVYVDDDDDDVRMKYYHHNHLRQQKWPKRGHHRKSFTINNDNGQILIMMMNLNEKFYKLFHRIPFETTTTKCLLNVIVFSNFIKIFSLLFLLLLFTSNVW